MFNFTIKLNSYVHTFDLYSIHFIVNLQEMSHHIKLMLSCGAIFEQDVQLTVRDIHSLSIAVCLFAYFFARLFTQNENKYISSMKISAFMECLPIWKCNTLRFACNVPICFFFSFQPFHQNICTLICKRGVLRNVCMKRLTRPPIL